MAHVGKGQRIMVAPLLLTVIAQDSCQEWRLVADQLREKYPKITALMERCEDEVLVHRPSLRHTGSSFTGPTHWNG